MATSGLNQFEDQIEKKKKKECDKETIKGSKQRSKMYVLIYTNTQRNATSVKATGRGAYT